MIETKPRINRGNRGQLFRATWLSSARCSETFRRTTERVECSAKCTWQWLWVGLNLFQILPTSWRDHKQWTKDPKNVAVEKSQTFLTHVHGETMLKKYSTSDLKRSTVQNKSNEITARDRERKCCKFKVPLRRKFCIPFSLQLLKVEVINTYHAKFYIEIPTGRPVILNVKFSFVLPPLLDSKNGRESHRELDLVAPRGIWRHTRTTTWPAFEWPISLKEAILVAQGPSLQRPRIVNTRK